MPDQNKYLEQRQTAERLGVEFSVTESRMQGQQRVQCDVK